MTTETISMLVSWAPLVVILAAILLSGWRLSRQYQQNIELSMKAVEAIRENTQALDRLSAKLDARDR